MTVVGLLLALVLGIGAASRWPPLSPLLRVLPAPFWCYVLPMLAATAGLLPRASPAYAWIGEHLLPVSLVYLLLGTDLGRLRALGRAALLTFLAGAAGITVAAPTAMLCLSRWLPADGWQALGVLTATWTGGSANMLAVKEAFAMSDEALAPLVILDTLVAYGWMAGWLAVAPLAARWDRWVGAVPPSAALTPTAPAADARPPRLATGILLGLALAGAAQAASRGLPTAQGAITRATWVILLVTTATLVLTMTPLRRASSPALTQIGYVLLFLLLASLGARVHLRALAALPILLLAALVYLSLHALAIGLTARWVRAPLGLVAAASQANFGGTASAPLVGSVFHPHLAPVGLLLALLGNALGTYVGFLTGHACRLLAHAILW